MGLSHITINIFILLVSKNIKYIFLTIKTSFYLFTGNVFVLILSDLIDEVKEKNDSPEQGLNELEASVTQQELQFSPHMEYISRHVYHSLSKENDKKTEKRVSLLYLLILTLLIVL